MGTRLPEGVMKCDGCGAPLVRPAVAGGPALLGIVIHGQHGKRALQLCTDPRCGGWDERRAK
jgi:hypothetical protein